MFYLLLAIICSSLLAIILRFSENRPTSTYGVCLFNYLTCCVEGYIFTSGGNPFSVPLKVTLVSVLTGAALLLSLVLYKVNIRNNGTVLSAVFSKLGVLIPTILSFTVFGETAKPLQFVGIAIAVAAILVINLGGGNAHLKKTEHKNLSSFLTMGAGGLVFLMIIGGLCDSMSKVYEFTCPREFDNRYLFLGFFFAMVITAVMMIINREKPSKFDIIFGVLVGIPNYFVSRFLLKALTSVPAFIIYPSYSVGTVILISILSLIIFREKLTKRQLTGTGMILASLVLLNI
ncbi:MAG: EamA family transporter [Clostridia bacterium]|nr:EamA family transporter [Clostridia bacterium]